MFFSRRCKYAISMFRKRRIFMTSTDFSSIWKKVESSTQKNDHNVDSFIINFSSLFRKQQNFHLNENYSWDNLFSSALWDELKDNDNEIETRMHQNFTSEYITLLNERRQTRRNIKSVKIHKRWMKNQILNITNKIQFIKIDDWKAWSQLNSLRKNLLQKHNDLYKIIVNLNYCKYKNFKQTRKKTNLNNQLNFWKAKFEKNEKIMNHRMIATKNIKSSNWRCK